MCNIYRGEAILKEDFIVKLMDLKNEICEDLLLDPLKPEIVIEAVHALADEFQDEEIVRQLLLLGVPKWASMEYVKVTKASLSKEQLLKKVHAELGEDPFMWKKATEDIEEKYQPFGVLLHIGAGNSLGLSAFSVIEGLLTGNINILKLPENGGGLSSMLLLRLVEIEPRLKPYIYVLDVSSRDREVITELIGISSAVVVWGSDEAISGIRQLVPPYLPIIEWGHRLSFAYFTGQDKDGEALQGLAKDICLTDQLYCSSPQCVFYETDNIAELNYFAERLAEHIEAAAKQFPPSTRPINVQAQITWTHELINMEEILGEKRLITNEKKEYSVMVDYRAELRASPLFRNIWVMPIKREKLLELLIVHRGHLQTVGLSCKKPQFEELCKIFYAAGINRITKCGFMSTGYSGESHDGAFALARYVRKVNRPIIII